MAAPDVTTASYSQGRLVIGPTDGDLSGTYPYGGTGLGLSAEVFVTITPRTFSLTMEEYGSEAGDVVELGEDVTIAALLVMGDDDNVSTLFQNTGAGATTGDQLVTLPRSSIGAMGSSRAVKLAFVPDDATHRGFIAYRALPLVDPSRDLSFNVQTANMVGVIFQCMRNGSGVTFREGRPADLVP